MKTTRSTFFFKLMSRVYFKHLENMRASMHLLSNAEIPFFIQPIQMSKKNRINFFKPSKHKQNSADISSFLVHKTVKTSRFFFV